jgi:ketosteroid isomerase-like protein
MLLSSDVDEWLASLKLEVHDSGLGLFQPRLVATAGERVCLERVLWSAGPAEGRVEIEYLWLAEVDESGRLVSGVAFDPEDWRAAHREALGRWLARDAAAAAVMGPIVELVEGSNDHDRARMRAVLADDLVYHDHRLVGQGRVDGADAYLDTLPALWDLARDIQLEPRFVLAVERHGMVAVDRTFGTLPEGGVFEIYWATVATVSRGRVTRIELFELEAVDAALARLAELRPDPLRIPPNAATRAGVRWHEAFAAGDWESVEALYGPTLALEDRRRGFLTSGDRQMLLASDRLIGSSRPRISRTVLATAGDRLALQSVLVAGTADDGAFEGVAFDNEILQVIEVDGDGRFVAAIWFDPEDRRAASMEMGERFRRGEGQRIPAAARDAMDALLRHDFERLRAALPDDFVFHDQRRTGLGRLVGAAAFVDSLAPVAEQAPDFCIETLYTVAIDEHGMLDMARVFGTLAASGGAFETCYARLASWRGDRIVSMELFEPEDLDRARARFEELCARSA